MTKTTLFILALTCLILPAGFLNGQIRTQNQLVDLIVQEFRNSATSNRRVVVRDFRVPGTIESEITEAVKQQLKDQGYTVSLAAPYEIEGRVKSTINYQGFKNYTFKLKIIGPNGYDRTQQFTLAPGVVDLSGYDSNSGNNQDETQNVPLPDRKPSGNRHQIYPEDEWKVYELPSKSLRHVKNGFIDNRGDWQTFWAMGATGIEIPRVDFEKQLIRIETVPYPQTINAEIFAAGGGSIDITKDISNDIPDSSGKLNAHVLIINKSDIQAKRKVRLGVTVDATYDNQGVIITSVVEGAPVTQGRMENGDRVSLEPGDVILSLDGITTNSVGKFASLIKDSRGILRAEVKNVNNGEIIFVTFELN